MKNFITATLLATSGLMIAGQAMAADQTASTTFQVKIQVLSTCSIAATDIVFNDVLSTNVTGTKTGSLSVNCTSQTPYSVGLSGSGEMTHQTEANSTISYELFKLESDTAQWNNDSNKYAATGSGTVQAIPVVAKITGSNNVIAGNYADTVTATVTY